MARKSAHQHLTEAVRHGAMMVMRSGVRAILEEKLEASGFEADGTLIEALIEHALSKTSDDFHWPAASPELEAFLAELDLTDADLAELEGQQAEFGKDVEGIIENTARTGAKALFEAQRRQWPEMDAYNINVQAGFEERLNTRWGRAFSALRMMRYLALERGEAAQKRLVRSRAKRQKVSPHLLLRLHTRACQVVGEIVALMQAGYADGANARWRTLHELTVVAIAIADGGETLAQRYGDHEAVSKYKADKLHQDMCASRGERPLSKAHMARAKAALDRAVATYGKGFKSDYGWAADYVGVLEPSFAQLEDKAGQANVRPEYKLACYNVHAGSRGLFFKLGALNGQTLLPGPTNAGFENPGCAAAEAIVQITALILPAPIRLDDLIELWALANARDATRKEFIRAANRLRRDHARIEAERQAAAVKKAAGRKQPRKSDGTRKAM